ncbi:hypothetical protein NPIL_244301 [Nephila pilipes]|uniref:Uncharacterized protein n=1 Tax=Nephila pilipes TaxID=299642 RepID=A0A8X6N4E1_NEPPI|nr:hypothetical protein NPIL_244301 [Nephila pilipes]
MVANPNSTSQYYCGKAGNLKFPTTFLPTTTPTETKMDLNSTMEYSSNASSRASSLAPGSPADSPCSRRRKLEPTIALQGNRH